MKRKVGVAVTLLLYAVIAVLIALVVHEGGNYPAGVDTMCHVYKGDVLYHSILKGNWYPLYDNLWYNGVQMMRYWAPLPVYFLALCQALAGGSEIVGYLIFNSFVFFFGAVIWLYIGLKKNRPVLGGFMGVLWFFMPNNLFALYLEGNLPRSLSMIFLPLFFYLVHEFLFEKQWKALKKVVPVFTAIVLCHTGYAGMIALAMLIFLLIYKIICKEKNMCLPVILSMVIPFALIGIWLYPSLMGGITSTDSSQVMKAFFQDALISLNPIRRLEVGVVDFYFGLAAFLVAVFGFICSKKQSMVGFCSAVIIFICTTSSMYVVLEKLPGSQYLWMLRFISIALCMILYSFFLWKTLRRGLIVICCVLLVADVLPSLSLLYNGKGQMTYQENMYLQEQRTLIDKAKKVTTQRVALMDESALGAMAQYLLTDYDGEKVQQTFGAGWQSAATANNIVALNEAMAQGYYTYLFDRALEMGNDTVLIKISQLREKEEDIDEVRESAKMVGYQQIETNNEYLLYHLETYDTFGTKCKYSSIGIGTSAPLMAYTNPDMAEGESVNLCDYTYEELSQYKMIYLAGFTYDDKEEAEGLVTKLSEAGIKILINGDGIPANERTKTREFLGVTCHEILFENGYPILYYQNQEIDCNLFDKDYADWQTVYFNNLDESYGYLYDSGRKAEFVGTTRNDNICFIGLNLPYHAYLTHDETALKLIRQLTGEAVWRVPDREIIPLEIEFGLDTITVISPQKQVNTGLAYHDIFVSKQKIEIQNQLTYVNEGITQITMKYPYLAEGLLLTTVGILLYVWFVGWLKKKYDKKGPVDEKVTEKLQKKGGLTMNHMMVLIPSLNPDEKLTVYVKDLVKIGFQQILIIDDGSKKDCQSIFKELEKLQEVTVVHHPENKGKGRGLKTGFTWCVENFEKVYGKKCHGIITADSDGQHSPKDTKKVALALAESDSDIVLGTRNFNEEQVPFKSRFGNKVTTVVFGALYGKLIHDTQTGLRGISMDLLQPLCELPGERFEYEIRMLIFAARKKLPCREVLIETIYIDENKETHFHPIKDSARIYSVIFGAFLKYLLSSLSSSLLDMGLFSVFHLWAFTGVGLGSNIFWSTVLARIVSSIYNFCINRKVVFGAKGNMLKHLFGYYVLVVIQMAASAGLVYVFTSLISGYGILVKMIVDTCLFLLSYQIQQRIIFRD